VGFRRPHREKKKKKKKKKGEGKAAYSARVGYTA
jgi:hypothetical protein